MLSSVRGILKTIEGANKKGRLTNLTKIKRETSVPQDTTKRIKHQDTSTIYSWRKRKVGLCELMWRDF